MKTKVVLLEHHKTARVGDVVELPDDEAQLLINTGNASLVAEPAKPEPKANKPAEKSTGNRSKTK
jgi:hypothetical protein